MDISRAFQTSSETISYFFTQGGTGYYIPLYQRKYSWDNENIDQLMDDICSGVFDLLSSQDKIHFMGTIILVMENDVPNNIKPQDHRAIPSRIDNVIDGQQRLSTIGLLACCLYQEIYEIKRKIPQNIETYQADELIEAADTYLTTIQELFSFDLMRGTPRRKPIIIRGSIDGWTRDEVESKHYKSDISSYLADFIRATYNIQNSSSCSFPKPRQKTLVARNIKSIQNWLNKVKQSHLEADNEYPPAWDIVKQFKQSELWSYERPELFEAVNNCKNLDSLDRNQKYLCSLVQLFAFSSYLLERCCFTVIRPVSQVRAFDMFQSLNATGTPLTAIETFKPLVFNIGDSETQGFKNSNFDKSFTKIEDLMVKLQSASSKNKRTNEYLTLFSLTYEGKSLSKQFSLQRKWLNEKFEKDCSSIESQEPSIEDKESFIWQMGVVAEYCKKIIYSSVYLNNSLPDLNLLDESQRKLSSFCLLYLQDANHKMAHTILSRFYSVAIRYKAIEEDNEKEKDDRVNSQKEFAEACKVVAAFFTLWRSALPNAGLDNVYRDLLHRKISWKKGDSQLTTKVLKEYFRNILQEQKIGTKDEWKRKTSHYLRYDNVQKVCKFALFHASNDTIPDTQQKGLMKIAKSNTSLSCLEPEKWNSEDLKSIEHIAPRQPDLQSDANWDEALYENDDYEQIGNLTLLPTPINSSAGNKNWLVKWIYYRHLAEKDPDNLASLKQEAGNNGVNLSEKTINLLQNASYQEHIQPIVQLGKEGKWDKQFVERRTDRICDILWERMNEWLS